MDTKRETAKAVAFRDITEDCIKEKTINYLFHETEILFFLGIPKPVFRQFNGGHYNKANAF